SVTPIDVHLKIWHGFNTVLILSIATLIAGTVVYFMNKPADHKTAFIAKYIAYSPENVFENLWSVFNRLSARYSNFMHNGFLRSYLIKIIIFAELLLIYELIVGGPIYIDYSKLSPVSVY